MEFKRTSLKFPCSLQSCILLFPVVVGILIGHVSCVHGESGSELEELIPTGGSGQIFFEDDLKPGNIFVDPNVTSIARIIPTELFADDVPSFSVNSPRRSFRLPSNVVPINYRLLSRPVLDEVDGFERLTAPSKIWIQIQCVSSTNEIVLHSNNLTINKELTQVMNLNTSGVISVLNQTFDIPNDFFILTLNESLEAGSLYQIYVDFVAPVYTNRRDGIYWTEYKDPANPNITKHLVSTLFAPTQARRAFLCFDEPQYKATFTINIGRTSNYSSLCNMKLLGTNPIPDILGWFSDHYETSVPMSTYLVAFVISNFANHTILSEDVFGGRAIQTWGDVNHVERNALTLASNFTSQLLPFFEDFLQYNYSLSKMDNIAMPKISYAGMESWGLIVYMESSLLYFPGQSTEEQRKRTTALISHELAHQWFGNLITFDWWSDIYLSEGLSTYIQYLGVDKFYPEFDSWSNFITDVFQSALNADSYSSTSHAIHQPIEKAQEIFTIYDKIAYDKGASLFNMMANFLTQPVFNAALRNYVKKYAFKAIHQDQMFETFNEEAEKIGALPSNTTVKDIMDTFTLQAGYPLVRVTQVVNESSILFEQEQYDPEGLGLNSTWYIPLTVTVENNQNFRDTFPTIWMGSNEKNKSFNVSRGVDEWVLVNAASSGFYRVLYDTNLTEAIQRQLYLNHTVFPASARCRIIDDYFSISFKRYTPVETALNMISYIGKETDFTVWKTVFSHLKYISEMLSEEDVHLSKWLSSKLESVFSIIDEESSPEEQENTPGVVALRRHFLLTWACYFKVPRCLAYASQLVQTWKDDPSVNPIPKAIKSTVYCSVAGGNDTDLSEFLLTQFKNEKDADESSLLIEGLSCARDMNEIQSKLTTMAKTLLNNENETSSSSSWSSALGEEQKLKMVLKGIIKSSNEGRYISWKFIQSFFMEAAEAKQLGKFSMFGEIILTLGSYWNTAKEKAELENFINVAGSKLEGNSLSGHLRSVLTRSLQARLDRVEKNIEWMQNFHYRVSSFFEIENFYFPEGFLN